MGDTREVPHLISDFRSLEGEEKRCLYGLMSLMQESPACVLSYADFPECCGNPSEEG